MGIHPEPAGAAAWGARQGPGPGAKALAYPPGLEPEASVLDPMAVKAPWPLLAAQSEPWCAPTPVAPGLVTRFAANSKELAASGGIGAADWRNPAYVHISAGRVGTELGLAPGLPIPPCAPVPAIATQVARRVSGGKWAPEPAVAAGVAKLEDTYSSESPARKAGDGRIPTGKQPQVATSAAIEADHRRKLEKQLLQDLLLDSEGENDTGSDDGYSDEDDNPLTELGRQQQIMQQQMMMEAATKQIPNPLPGSVPLDSNGQPTSIGSIAHVSGGCKVCIFAHSKLGCSNGVACGFCHFPHKRGRRKNKLRPCKGKRDRYRKLLNRLTNLIECDPHFNMEKVELPPSIASNEAVRAKLMATIKTHAEQVKASRVSGNMEAVHSDSSGGGDGLSASPAVVSLDLLLRRAGVSGPPVKEK